MTAILYRVGRDHRSRGPVPRTRRALVSQLADSARSGAQCDRIRADGRGADTCSRLTGDTVVL